MLAAGPPEGSGLMEGQVVGNTPDGKRDEPPGKQIWGVSAVEDPNVMFNA